MKVLVVALVIVIVVLVLLIVVVVIVLVVVVIIVVVVVVVVVGVVVVVPVVVVVKVVVVVVVVIVALVFTAERGPKPIVRCTNWGCPPVRHLMNKDFAFASHLRDVRSLAAANETALPLGGSE